MAAFNHPYRLSLSVTQNDEVWSPWFIEQTRRCQVKLDYQDRQLGAETTISSPGCTATESGRMHVAGDSHASAYTKMLAKFAQEENYEIRLYWISCSFMNFRVATSDMTLRCAHFVRQAATEIENAVTANDFVFLPSLRVDRYQEAWGGIAAQTRKRDVDEAAVQEAISFISRLSERGAKVILEAPLPVFRSPPFRCSDWFNRNNPICEQGFVVSRQDEEARRAHVVEIEHRITRSMPNVSIWDPLPIVCDAQECSAYKAGMPLFFDGDHLSGTGNILLYDSFRQHMEEHSRAAAATDKDPNRSN